MGTAILRADEVKIGTVADELEILIRKMESVLTSIHENLAPGDEDAHLDGLVAVMGDLVEEPSELHGLVHQVAVRLSRGSRSDPPGGRR
jgi:hypothetical protein